MLIQMNWLQEYVSVPWSAAELGNRLTDAGQKLEGIHCPGAGVSGIVAGRIETVEQHPQAERLVVCQVDLGDRRITVVTGAPNVRAGMIVPVALPGATVVGREEPIVASDFRGVESYGMLCAEDELGISDDHSGVMELPPDTQPGSDLVQLMLLGDAVLDFEIYPNRPDCQSVVGMAREVAALTRGALRVPSPAPTEEGEHVSSLARVTVEAPDLCSRYCARVIRGVKQGPSPLWMQQRLRAAGMRPINNVVDITNYVMLELGQPLHAFDLARLHDRHIVVRRARPGEKMRTLDGQERALDPDMLVIADSVEAVAIAGVMGGENSEITPDTVDLLLESATFDSVSVRKTSRRLGLRTEASARFERGLDPHLAPLAADRAAELLVRFCGGTVAPGMIDVHTDLPAPLTLRMRPARVNKILGTRLAESDMVDYLTALGFTVSAAEGAGAERSVAVTVPSFRRDVTREIDLIEEIGRMYGYENIPATLPQGAATRGGESRQAILIDRVRNACIAAGLREAISYSFTSPRHFDWLRLPEDDWRRRAIRIANPLSEDTSVMRTTLLGNLMEAVSRNVARQVTSVHLFEIGSVFIPREWPVAGQPDEVRTLGVAMMGALPGTSGSKAEMADFFAVKGVLESIGRALSLDLRVERGEHPSLHPGRTGLVMLGEEQVGYLGEVHPQVLNAYELPQRVCVMELDLDQLLGDAGKIRAYKPLPKFPAVTRDLALLVPLDVEAAKVAAAITQKGGSLLESLELFDVYQGKQVPAGYRSLAYSLTFRAADRTLTDADVNAVVAAIEAELATLRVQLRR